MCRIVFLSGVISHPATPEDETSGNLQQLVWSHGETAVLVVSCKAVGFLSVAACCTWWNSQGPQTSPSLQIASGWKEQTHTDKVQKSSRIVQHAGYKNLVGPSLSVFLTMSTTNEGGPNPSKKKPLWRVSAFCVSLLLSISLQINGLPLIATEFLLWLQPSPHVAKLPSGVPVPVAPISYLQSWRKWSRVNRPTAEVPTLPDPVKYKISIGRSHKFPNMGSNRLPQLSDPPFIGQHMLLPCTSARPISQHCLAERPALHSVRRARPMQPCPATASRGRSWRQPALSTGSSCSARCSPPNQRYNWIANKLTSPSPKNTYQSIRFEEPAPTQTAELFMDNHRHTLLDAYLQTGIYGGTLQT